MTYSNVLGRIVAATLSMCIITSGATVALTFSADSAWANNGNGDGNGRGSANRSNTRSANGNSNSNSNSSGRSNFGNSGKSNQTGNDHANNGGGIARELKSLNSAHASPSALANATPGSMPGKLRDYRDTFRGLVSAVEQQNAAYAEYLRLSEMSESQVAQKYPNGGHGLDLASATSNYTTLRHNAATAQAQNQATLYRLTDGVTLSDAAMEDLHVLLGL